MNSKTKEWGYLLAEKRKALNISQLELAEITSLSDVTIRSIENGKNTSAIGNWLKVCDALGFTIDITIKRMSDENR